MSQFAEADLCTLRLAARAFSRLASTSDLVEWAVDRLQRGYETKRIVELAGLDPINGRLDDAILTFRCALADEGIELEGQDIALRAYFRALARRIERRSLDPLAGLRLIEDEIISVGLHFAPYEEFHPWYEDSLHELSLLDSEIGFAEHEGDLNRKDYPAIVRAAVERSVARMNVPR